MKFTITREQLAGALQGVLPIVPKKAVLPVLSCVSITADADGVTVSATDLDMAIRVRVPAAVDVPGTVVVPGGQLLSFVKEMPSAGIRVTATGKAVQIECGRQTIELLTMDADDVPAWPVVDASSVTLPAAELLRLFELVSFAASTDELRPALRGILWRVSDGVVLMVATNGHVLARVVVPSASTIPNQPDCLLPATAVAHLKRLFGGDEEVVVSRAVSHNHIAFRSAAAELVTRLIDAPYPDYERVIPTNNSREAVIDRGAFMTVVRRAAVLANLQENHRVALAFSGDKCVVSSSAPELGKTSEDLLTEYAGKPFRIGFSSTYLQAVLSRFGTESVRMTFSESDRAATIHPVASEAQGDYTAVVMPLRLLD